MPTFLHGRVISFFQGVTISLLKETILAGTATAEQLIMSPVCKISVSNKALCILSLRST
jgi:hypothetical protein